MDLLQVPVAAQEVAAREVEAGQVATEIPERSGVLAGVGLALLTPWNQARIARKPLPVHIEEPA